jgi:hypothetical protein
MARLAETGGGGMNIYLGNLTVKQIEKRLEIELTENERTELESCREEVCDKVRGHDVWHCYDVPFEMVVGSKQAADTVYKVLFPYSSKMKCALRVSADYGK